MAATASPETERWLPLFWGLDYFKDSQARDVQEGNWTMRPVDESAVPPADKSRRSVAAMGHWDESAADAAVAGLARRPRPKEVFEFFYPLRCPGLPCHRAQGDLRGRRGTSLQFIGWEHAEPVLRSLAYALPMHEGDNPAQRDAEADRPWRQHPSLVKRLSGDLGAGKADAGATRDLLAVLRNESYQSAAAKVVEVLNRGVAVQSAWDALFCGAGELPFCHRDRRLACCHDHQRDAPRLSSQRRSGDPQVAPPTERLLPADVPRGDAGSRFRWPRRRSTPWSLRKLPRRTLRRPRKCWRPSVVIGGPRPARP